MVRTERAALLCKDDILEMLESECGSYTVDKLCFVETKTKDGVKIFPCYVNDTIGKDKEERMLMTVVQRRGQQYDMAMVRMFFDKMGITFRLWDRPPTKGLSEDTPWEENPEEEKAATDDGDI